MTTDARSDVAQTPAPLIDRDTAMGAFWQLLMAMGHDVDTEALRETPRRYVDALLEITTPEPFRWTTFPSEGHDEIVAETGITFYSLCEHHVLPFFGVASVAYLPDDKIVGLSKLARCVRFHAAGLSTQEYVTMAVADEIEARLRTRGVAVVLRARHLCMEMRGVRSAGTITTTSAMRGAFRNDASARAEVLSLLDTETCHL